MASAERKRLRKLREARARIEVAGFRATVQDRLAAGKPLREIAEPESDLDGKLIPYFGAQVGWGLYRETAKLLGEVCTECRDNPVPGRAVCMGCLKSNRDGEIAALRAREG